MSHVSYHRHENKRTTTIRKTLSLKISINCQLKILSIYTDNKCISHSTKNKNNGPISKYLFMYVNVNIPLGLYL